MKKYIYGLFLALVSVAMLTACSAEEGTNPGSDGEAHVQLYQYAAAKPNDPDVDTQIRIATNSATQSAYLLVEKTTAYDSHVAELGEEGYKDYVIEHGEKVEGATGAANIDKTIKDLKGDNTITVVAVGNGNKYAAKVTFNAISWTTVAEGTYYFGSVGSELFAQAVDATLQVNDSDPTTYRFKDFWTTGVNFTFKLTGQKAQLQDGNVVRILTVSPQATPYTYSSYGTVYFADALTRKAANVPSYMYEDNDIVFAMTYYVGAGNLGSAYEEFVPNE